MPKHPEHIPEYLVALNDLRGHSLPQESHTRIRASLSEYADFHTVPAPAARPAVPTEGMLMRLFVARRIYAGVAAFALAIGLMGGAAFASEKALPGDLLYAVKVNVNEPVQVALAGTAQDKAAVEATLAERRLDEAAKLAVVRGLDTQTASYLAQQFSTHVDNSLAAADRLQQDGNVDASLSVRSDLEARLDARNDILALVANHLEAAGASTTTIASTQDLLHAIALRRSVVSDTRLALEHDRGDSASKTDTLALVTKASDAGAATDANIKADATVLPRPVAQRVHAAANALAEAQASLGGDQPQDASRAYHKAQEATRATEVASILLKNAAFLRAIATPGTATSTATSTDTVATTTVATTTPAGD